MNPDTSPAPWYRDTPGEAAQRRLAAAAPDLLAALVALLPLVDRLNAEDYGSPRPTDGSRDWREQVSARAAIAKATATP
jgi:hypothetical protein